MKKNFQLQLIRNFELSFLTCAVRWNEEQYNSPLHSGLLCMFLYMDFILRSIRQHWWFYWSRASFKSLQAAFQMKQSEKISCVYLFSPVSPVHFTQSSSVLPARTKLQFKLSSVTLRSLGFCHFIHRRPAVSLHSRSFCLIAFIGSSASCFSVKPDQKSSIDSFCTSF